MAPIVHWPAEPGARADLVARAAAILRRGGLVVIPTDTVYGVAALASLPEAVERLFAAKGRPAEKAIPWLVADLAQAEATAGPAPASAHRLAARFWPGGLTLVLPVAPERQPSLPPTVAFRAPDHRVPLALLRALGEPIAATSANRSGEPSARDAREAAAALAETVELIIDDGPAPAGVPSSIVDCASEPPRLLREGALSRALLAEALAPLRLV